MSNLTLSPEDQERLETTRKELFEERTRQYEEQKTRTGVIPFELEKNKLAQDPIEGKEETTYIEGVYKGVEPFVGIAETVASDITSFPNAIATLVGHPDFAESIIYEPRTEAGKMFNETISELYEIAPRGMQEFVYNLAIENDYSEEDALKWSEQAHTATAWGQVIGALLIPAARSKGLKKLGLDPKETTKSIKVAETTVAAEAGLEASRMSKREGLPETGETLLPSEVTPITQQAGDLLTDPTTGQNIKFLDDEGNPLPEKENQRLFQNIADMLDEGIINIESFPELAKKYDLTPEEFGDKFRQTISQAGKNLNRLSQLQKRLNKTFKDDPEAMEYVNRWFNNKEPYAPGTLDKLGNFFTRFDNTSKIALTSQIATSMRNIITTGGFTVVDAMEKVLTGAVRGTVKAGEQISLKPYVEEMYNIGNYFKGFNRLNPKKKDELFNILEEANGIYEAMLYKERLAKGKGFDTAAHLDVYGNVFDFKIPGTKTTFLEGIHALNRGQERAFQRFMFEAELRYQLSSKGLDYDNIDPKEIPEEALQKALNSSLEKTFARQPSSEAGKKILGHLKNPVVSMLGMPFPRFMFANNLKTTAEFGPWTLLKFMSKKQRAAMRKDPELAYQTVSRTMIGTAVLGSAVQQRMNADPDQKWYEFRVDEGTMLYESMPEEMQKKVKGGILDLRPFAPLSNYFLVAEAIVNPNSISAKEVSEALFSLGRVGGTGLALADILRTSGDKEGQERAWDILYNGFVGYVNRLFVPARTLKDLSAGWNPEDAVIRSTKEQPNLSKLANNFPFLNTVNPPKYSPTQGEIKQESPVFKQLTGLAIQHKGQIQREADALKLEYGDLYKYNTGDKKADNLLADYHSRLFIPFMNEQMKSAEYLNTNNAGKRIIFKKILSETRKTALIQMLNSDRRSKGYTKGVTDRQVAFNVIKSKQLDKDLYRFLINSGVDAAAQTVVGTKLEGLLYDTPYEKLLEDSKGWKQEPKKIPGFKDGGLLVKDPLNRDKSLTIREQMEILQSQPDPTLIHEENNYPTDEQISHAHKYVGDQAKLGAGEGLTWPVMALDVPHMIKERTLEMPKHETASKFVAKLLGYEGVEAPVGRAGEIAKPFGMAARLGTGMTGPVSTATATYKGTKATKDLFTKATDAPVEGGRREFLKGTGKVAAATVMAAPLAGKAIKEASKTGKAAKAFDVSAARHKWWDTQVLNNPEKMEELAGLRFKLMDDVNVQEEFRKVNPKYEEVYDNYFGVQEFKQKVIARASDARDRGDIPALEKAKTEIKQLGKTEKALADQLDRMEWEYIRDTKTDILSTEIKNITKDIAKEEKAIKNGNFEYLSKEFREGEIKELIKIRSKLESFKKDRDAFVETLKKEQGTSNTSGLLNRVQMSSIQKTAEKLGAKIDLTDITPEKIDEALKTVHEAINAEKSKDKQEALIKLMQQILRHKNQLDETTGITPVRTVENWTETVDDYDISSRTGKIDEGSFDIVPLKELENPKEITNWLGKDSYFVDSKGNPIVFYRSGKAMEGTDDIFSYRIENPEELGSHAGHKEAAKDISSYRNHESLFQGFITNVKKPLELYDTEGTWSVEDAIYMGNRDDAFSPNTRRKLEKLQEDLYDLEEYLNVNVEKDLPSHLQKYFKNKDWLGQKAFNQLIKEDGYDVIKYINDHEGNQEMSIIVTDKATIKPLPFKTKGHKQLYPEAKQKFRDGGYVESPGRAGIMVNTAAEKYLHDEGQEPDNILTDESHYIQDISTRLNRSPDEIKRAFYDIKERIKYHESADKNIYQKSKGLKRGPAAGYYQYEQKQLGGSGSSRVATNRAIAFLQKKNIPLPKWLQVLDKETDPDFTQLTEEQQDFLFVADKNQQKFSDKALLQILDAKTDKEYDKAIEDYWYITHKIKGKRGSFRRK